ncbi:hypothetical protein KBD71_00740 [Candidatus Woesebacteria bacterium]|nr:hypothetical protein [Candidatus Woesebacteria bacterium]
MTKTDRVRLEWASWVSRPHPDRFCEGMRYFNTRDLSSSGFTPTLLPAGYDFINNPKNRDLFPVTEFEAVPWQVIQLTFEEHLMVAIGVLTQIQELLKYQYCLWDRHGENILVNPKNPQHVFQVDLETVFDMRTSSFRHEKAPMTSREFDHLTSAKFQRRLMGHPVNIQVNSVLSQLSTKLEWTKSLSDEKRRETQIIMDKWGRPLDDNDRPQLQKFLSLLRSLQQRL